MCIDNLLLKIKKLENLLKASKTLRGCLDTCSNALSKEYECDCGYEIIKKAIKEYEDIDNDTD